ncbi:MAG: GTP-binding protein [Candidatus Woesearchaeota archaeon]|jgi:hypothetical protein|nr:GTP-binding protein [Candidatus Woesearchaeota archaeon]MDP7198914.1 GTP-binding protein [Candidatus Woesearchaeota archaeon]MDP7467293.1 GTP-binding protein [Candidatus Woesearchaeota archaeon]MDP7647909.1 GTP-binding protein [Candidatus Woesearchaeota archaeon]
MDYDSEIKRLQDELRDTQYNKATEHHFGVVKARMAELRRRNEKRIAAKSGGKGFDVKRSGNATVVLLGFPSVGKSTLLNKLVGTKSKAASYAFTTVSVIPGLLEYNHAKIQILDVPGIVHGAASGRGRGKEVLGVIRNCDAILVVVDAQHPEHYDALLREVDEFNVRINQALPDVKVTKKEKGGIDLQSTVKLSLDKETIKTVLHGLRINNAEVIIREDITVDQLIDVVEGNRSYIPALTAISKIDLVDKRTRERLIKNIKPDVVVSGETGEGIKTLKRKLYKKLRFMRIFMKEVRKKADMDIPLIVRKGSTVQQICEKVHRDLARKFKYARIWGPTAKFDGQVIRDKKRALQDQDVIEIHS